MYTCLTKGVFDCLLCWFIRGKTGRWKKRFFFCCNSWWQHRSFCFILFCYYFMLNHFEYLTDFCLIWCLFYFNNITLLVVSYVVQHLLNCRLFQGEKKLGSENNRSISCFLLLHQAWSVHNMGRAGPMLRKTLFSRFALQNIFIL